MDPHRENERKRAKQKYGMKNERDDVHGTRGKEREPEVAQWWHAR